MHQANARDLLALDVVDHELGLDAVVQADAEDVVLGFFRVAADDHLRCGQRHHQGDFLLLRDVDHRQGDARVGRPDDRAHPVAGDQAGDVFHALRRLGFVVVDDQLDLLALVAAGRVELVGCEFDAHARTLAEIVGAAGQRQVDADLQVGGIGGTDGGTDGNGAGGADHQAVRCIQDAGNLLLFC